MYRPNFCSECGTKTVRLHWHLWTSRRFCDKCARRLRKERLLHALVIIGALISTGFIAGRASRPAPPTLIIERAANSPLFNSAGGAGTSNEKNVSSGLPDSSNTSTQPAEVYICGARTKKGKPCSRRVNSAVRCWQHKGTKAMLPEEKLLLSDKL